MQFSWQCARLWQMESCFQEPDQYTAEQGKG